MFGLNLDFSLFYKLLFLVQADEVVQETTSAVTLGTSSILLRAWQGGFVVFSVLLVLMACSIVVMGILLTKLVWLKRINHNTSQFVEAFWESKSLNALHARLDQFLQNPTKEIFRHGYGELIKAKQMRNYALDSHLQSEMHLSAMDNLKRTLHKVKQSEKESMEKYLWILAVCASACPFIGLFGTVWGIMNAFEGIAVSGNTSLTAVAPGISEALVATAFGLVAAIPAAVGLNVARKQIKSVDQKIQGFMMDFLNIVERYFLNERQKAFTEQRATK